MKNTVLKKAACVFCLAGALLALPGCGGKEEPVPTREMEVITLPPPPTEATVAVSDKSEIQHLDAVLVAGELYTLDSYPNLKSVNLSGSTCYEAIQEFMVRRPDLRVTYTVDLGGTAVDHDAGTITLNAGSYDPAVLLENLQYLANLTTISLPNVDMKAEEIAALMERYPNITLDYSVDILGVSVTSGDTQLDLYSMTSGQVAEAAPKLSLLPNLLDVTLSDELSKADVKALQTAAPNTVFRYSFSLFGKTISTADAEIVYEKHSIGNEGEAQLREALDILNHCDRFVLDNCGLDYEVLAKIREDYREQTKVVWRVYFGVDGRYNLLTDADTLRAVYNVTDETCGPMKYCEGVKYMDIGHNKTLTDLSFISYMPDIEVVIASESAVKELVGLENCKKLTWLELAYCYNLENIDCLAQCDGLRFLNISYSKVKSLAPLDGLELERFVYLKPKASTEEQNTFLQIHPRDECITVFYGYSMPYSYGWRYDDNGKTYFSYYKDVIRKVFDLDRLEALLPKDDK